jgi:chromosomal replication initiation ATPase DnaA
MQKLKPEIMKRIIEKYCAVLGITVQYLNAPYRDQLRVDYRCVLWKILYRDGLGYSQIKIGKSTGNRSNATVSSGIARANRLLSAGDRTITDIYSKTGHIEIKPLCAK